MFGGGGGPLRTVAHGGATNGQLSAFLLVPERNFAITVLTNANSGRELHRDLVNWALEHFLSLRDPEPVSYRRPDKELQEFVGHYESRLAHLDVTVQDGGLLMNVTPQPGFPYKDSPPSPAPPPVPLAFISDAELFVTDGPLKGGHVDVIRDEAGRVAWLRASGRVHRRM